MRGTTKSMVCDTPVVERPRYFPRQLITPEDMTMEQDYFRNRMRMHNRMLHGWGVVCGALVCPVVENGVVQPWRLKVEPGYVLGPYGDEIIIACDVEVDLRKEDVTGTALDPCGTSHDPWCSDVWIERDPSAVYYIAVKYEEMAVHLQRVQPAGCGCDEGRCEFSRWRDGYKIGVLTDAEYRQIETTCDEPPDWGELFQLPYVSNPACWPCPPQPWVVLASVRLDEDGGPLLIDNCGPRRLVAALGNFCWTCAGGVEINDISVEPADSQLVPGQTYEIDVYGSGFQENLSVFLGPGLSVVEGSLQVNPPDSFKMMVQVEEGAQPGPRDLVVVNPDCSTATYKDAVTIASVPQVRVHKPPREEEAAAADDAAEEAEAADKKPKRTTRKRKSEDEDTE